MNNRDYPTLHLDTNNSKEQFVVTHDMNVNKHGTQSNILQIKVQEQC
jgi:hypothetical protein